MKSKEEARLVEDASQEAKKHEHAQMKVEEGVHIALEARRRSEEEYLGLKDEYARLKSEAEDQACLKDEEEDQISVEARLKAEDHKCARLKVEEEFLLTLEARQQAEKEEYLRLKAE